MSFIAPPPAKGPRIPVITIRQLVDALALYLPTITNYAHSHEDIRCDREDMCTIIEMHSKELMGVDNRPLARIYVRNKAVRNTTSKLWAEPFPIRIFVAFTSLSFDVVIEPRQDKSIAIHKVLSWDGSRPIYE